MGKQSLGSCYNLLSKYGDFKKTNSITHSVVTLGHFFPQKKAFLLVTMAFFGSQGCKNLPKTKNANSNSPSNHLKNVIQNSNDMNFHFVDHGA
jgi:hypothetical protein